MNVLGTQCCETCNYFKVRFTTNVKFSNTYTFSVVFQTWQEIVFLVKMNDAKLHDTLFHYTREAKIKTM